MTPPPSGKRHSCRVLRAAPVATILAFGAATLSPLHAEDYQFIVSGYPAANESYAAVSSGTALATATRSGRSAASQLEARFRTWQESIGIALKSTKFRRFILTFR